MSGTFRSFATECCVDGGGAMAQRPMLGENCLPMPFAHSDNSVDMRVAKGCEWMERINCEGKQLLRATFLKLGSTDGKDPQVPCQTV
ncbi:hypothetical protein DBR06_SOUSAS21110003 [Sousa chinensis]|nr:hypothetical protein DBR06_SOUSAS21110003 [Sousa chinensis]